MRPVRRPTSACGGCARSTSTSAQNTTTKGTAADPSACLEVRENLRENFLQLEHESEPESQFLVFSLCGCAISPKVQSFLEKYCMRVRCYFKV